MGLCAALALPAYGAPPPSGAIACSTQASQANLNELKMPGGGNLKFVETKILENGVDVTGWQICIRETKVQGKNTVDQIDCIPFGYGNYELNNSNPAVYDIDDFFHDAETYLTLYWNLNPTEAEIILLDENNTALDYIRYCSGACTATPYWSVSTQCGVQLENVEANTQVIARYPVDGTGGWMTDNQPGGPTGPTQGTTNDPNGIGGPFTIGITVGAAASTCVAQNVTFTIYDNQGNIKTNFVNPITITTSSGHGDWSIVSANGALDNGAADDGTAVYNFVGADNGQVTLALRNSHADDLSISASATNAGGGPSNLVSFRTNAFVITPLTTTAGVANSTEVVAGRPHDFRIEMWEQDPANTASCSVAASYDGCRPVRFSRSNDALHPAAALSPSIGGQAITTANGPVVNVTFAAGVATVTLNTTDVGKYSLNVVDDSRAFANAVDIIGSTDLLTVRPFALGFTGIAQGVLANPGGLAPTGTRFIAAGDDFEALVGGYLWAAADDPDSDGVPALGANVTDNGLTPAYAWATSLSAAADVTSFTPSGGAGDTPGVLSGTVNVAQANFTGGIQDPASLPPALRYDDVGSVTLYGEALGFLGTAGVNVIGFSNPVGRFYPHHFTPVAVGVSPYVEAACTAGANDFTYMDEADLTLRFIVEARSRGEVVTSKYDATLLGAANVADVAFSAENANEGTELAARLVTSVDIADPAAVYWVAGQFQFEDTLVAFSRAAAPDGPYDDLAIAVRVLNDPDGADMDSYDLKASDTNDCTADGDCDARVLATTAVRYGRLEATNVAGNESTGLTLPLYTAYYTSGGFVPNTWDVCTALALNNLALSNPSAVDVRSGTIAVGGGTTTASLANPAAVNGQLDVDFTAPGVPNTGYVDVLVDLSNGLNGANLPWLEFDWDGDVLTPPSGPRARATFGIYTGNERQIYIREVY